jgi:hypothetical protein
MMCDDYGLLRSDAVLVSMEPADFFETLVLIYQPRGQHIPHDLPNSEVGNCPVAIPKDYDNT